MGSRNPNACALMGYHPADITFCRFDEAQSASKNSIQRVPTWVISLCLRASVVNKPPGH